MVRDYELMMELQVSSVGLFLVQHVKRVWQIIRLKFSRRKFPQRNLNSSCHFGYYHCCLCTSTFKHTQVRLCFYSLPLYHHIVITCSSMFCCPFSSASMRARQLYDSFSVSWTVKCTVYLRLLYTFRFTRLQ